MKKIYVCSPYHAMTPAGAVDPAGIALNRQRALRACRDILLLGFAPIAPHLIYPLVLDDTDIAQRTVGIEAGCEWIGACNEMWVLGASCYENASLGMQREIALAKRLNVSVYYSGKPSWWDDPRWPCEITNASENPEK